MCVSPVDLCGRALRYALVEVGKRCWGCQARPRGRCHILGRERRPTAAVQPGTGCCAGRWTVVAVVAVAGTWGA